MNILAEKYILVVCPRNISITALITNLGVEMFYETKVRLITNYCFNSTN